MVCDCTLQHANHSYIFWMEIKPIEGGKDNTLAPNQQIIFLACIISPHNV